MLFIDQVSIKHKTAKPLFKPLSFEVSPGEVISLMGPSGCGKSTLLAAINGSLSSAFTLHGEIFLNQQPLNNITIEERQIGTLFQDDLLFPHMNVTANLMYGLPSKLKYQEKKNTVKEALNTAGLADFMQRDVKTLSGGQRARISLLRTLLSKPKALLLDEPFGKLDQQLRDSFRTFVYDAIKTQNIPALLVTHDPQDCPVKGTIIRLDSNPQETTDA